MRTTIITALISCPLILVLYIVDVTLVNPPTAQANGRSDIQELAADIRRLTSAVEANTRALGQRR